MLAAICRLLSDTGARKMRTSGASAHTTLRNLGDTDTPPAISFTRCFMIMAQTFRFSKVTIEASNLSIGPPKMDQPPADDALFRASGKNVALCRVGHWGSIANCAFWKGHGEKERQRPCFSNFREARASEHWSWDFEGTRLIATRSYQPRRYPTGQPTTIAQIAAGYSGC